MFLSNEPLSKLKEATLDLQMIKFLLPATIVIITFLSFIVILNPVFAADSSPKVSQVKKEENLFERIVSLFKAPAVFAQNQAKPTPKPAVKQQPNIFQQILNFITAPFKALTQPKASPKATPKATPATPAAAPAASPEASPQSAPPPQTQTTNPAPAASAPAAVSVSSLGAGVTYIDLIGQTIVDSAGKIYPSSNALTKDNKPSLGTSTNKFYGLFLQNFEVGTGGALTAKSTVNLGDESGDTIKMVGRIGSDIVPTNNDEVTLGKSGNAFKQAFITTVTSSTVTAGTLNITTMKIEDGTASAPGLQFTNDTDTGLFRIGANRLGLITAGSAISGITIDGSGNVGIGITTPGQALEVIGTARIRGATGNEGFVVASNGNVGIGLTDPYVQLAVRGSVVAEGNVGVGTSTALGTALQVNGTGIFWPITTALSGPSNGLAVFGNVGIGASLPNAKLAVQGSVGIGFTGVSQTMPSNGLAVSGNVGIGVTTANNALQVLGAGLFSGSWGGAVVPTNGLVVEGNTGIGISAPSQLFQVGTAGSALAFTSGGNLGIGITTPSQALEVIGTARIRGATGNTGLVVAANGNVGIGTTAPGAGLQLTTNGLIGYTGNVYGPASGLAVSGNVGAGTTTPSAALHSIGSTTANAQTFAGIFEGGNVGIGTSAPNALLVVGAGTNAATARTYIDTSGNVGIGTSATGSYLLTVGTAATGQFRVASGGNVGIGTTYGDGGYLLDVGGKVRATGYFGNCSTPTFTGNCNQDVAELYDSLEDVGPGDVLVIDSASQRYVKKSTGVYDQNLIGVVSSTPGLLLGISGQNVALGSEANAYALNADPKKPAVALSGKIPVKVIGSVKSGDYLTSSSIAGVATKATKAGPVIGQALEDYSGEGVGQVMMFVRLGYFNGTKIVDLIAQDAIAGLTTNFSEMVLARLLAEREALAASNASELLTDRVAAGVEVITPQLTADNIVTGVIKPLEEKNLTLALTSKQGFNITNENNEAVISFDSQGNAYFKGRVVAAAVKADQIEGLRVLTDALITNKIAALVDQKLSQGADSDVAGAATEADTLDVATLIKLNADGGLSVGGPAEFKGSSIFSALAEFVSNVIFKGDVSFIGRIFLPKDSTGVAVIQSGSDSVTVSFARGYGSAPSVNVTQTNYAGNDGAGNSILTGDVRFVVQGLSGSGFTIKLNRAAPADMVFSWTALAQSNQFTSTAPASTSDTSSSTSPASTPAPSAEPSPEPSATPVPSASPEPESESTESASLTTTP